MYVSTTHFRIEEIILDISHSPSETIRTQDQETIYLMTATNLYTE